MPTRLPRFRRAANPTGMVLTDRDLQLLHRVARHRFLTSRQIVRVLSAPAQPILRRLQVLFHHGYLDRPRAQIEYFHRGGSRPLIYGLGRRAVPVLFSTAEHRPRPDNLQVGRLHLQHTVLIAEILIGIELACAERGDVRFIAESELRKDGTFRWSVVVRHGGIARRVGIVPDAVFAIESATGRRAYYFVEADRGTMPIQRDSLAQSSFFRKLLAYAGTWTQDVHRRQFGFHRFRVLTVTASSERAAHLRDVVQELPTGRGLFLFRDDATPVAEWVEDLLGTSS